MAKPTCVHHAKWNNSNETGNTFVFRLKKENASLTNNCLRLTLYFPSTATLSSIVDNVSNAWSTTPVATATDSGNSVTVSEFHIYGCTAGTTSITVTFAASVAGCAATYSEWYNVATSSALDGTPAAQNLNTSAAAPQVVSGPMTTANNGSLIVQTAWCSDNGGGGGGGSGFNNKLQYLQKNTPGFKFLQAELNAGYFQQYWVQDQAGAVNPSVTLGQATFPSSWISLTVALKAASAGTAPSSGMRLFGMIQTVVQGNGTTTANVAPEHLPFVGNLLVMMVSDPVTSIGVTAISGASSGTWTVVSSSGGDAQCAYKTNAANANDNEILAITLNDPTAHVYVFAVFYDWLNAGAFDKSLHSDSSTTFGPGNSTPAVSFTPGISTGNATMVAGTATGPSDSLVSPAGTYLLPTYTGETDLSGMTNGDVHASFDFTSNAAQSWVYQNTAASNGYGMLIVSFSPGPIITTQPANQQAAPGDSVTFTAAATASAGSVTYQWKRNGSTVTGATSASYTFTPNYPADVGAVWYCDITDSNATVSTVNVQVVWTVEAYFSYGQTPPPPTQGYIQLNAADVGDQDYKSELTLLRWF